MFQIFLNNFFSFDFLIFIVAILNLVLVFRTRHLVKDVLTTLKPQGYLPGGEHSSNKIKEHYELYLSPEGEQILQEKQRKTNFSYTLFENITTLFPLMGILGTVISLIPMVNEMSSSIAQSNLFFSALTSTFWGIVFAIIFKAINGFVQSELDFSNKLTDLYFERNSLLFDSENKNNDYAKRNRFVSEKKLTEFKLDYPIFKKDIKHDLDNIEKNNAASNQTVSDDPLSNNKIIEEETKSKLKKDNTKRNLFEEDFE